MNEKTNELKSILRSSRQRGNTSYLLEAALNNPNVTIIVANQAQAKTLQKQYDNKIQQLSWWQKAIRKITKKGYPHFVSMRNSRELENVKRPVVVDLHAVATAI